MLITDFDESYFIAEGKSEKLKEPIAFGSSEPRPEPREVPIPPFSEPQYAYADDIWAFGNLLSQILCRWNFFSQVSPRRYLELEFILEKREGVVYINSPSREREAELISERAAPGTSEREEIGPSDVTRLDWTGLELKSNPSYSNRVESAGFYGLQ